MTSSLNTAAFALGSFVALLGRLHAEEGLRLLNDDGEDVTNRSEIAGLAEFVVKGGVTWLDPEDVEAASLIKWGLKRGETAGATSYVRSRYPVRTKSGHMVRTLHGFVMDVPSGVMLDHIDRNGLNNSKRNLRRADASLNGANRLFATRPNKTGLRGVHLCDGRFRARLQVRGRDISLGCFASAEEAGRAYDTAAVAHFGEFAVLNFPPQSADCSSRGTETTETSAGATSPTPSGFFLRDDAPSRLPPAEGT